MSMSNRNKQYTSNNMTYSPRHSNPIGSFLDHLSLLMVYPWATVMSKIGAYYMKSSQPISWSDKLTEMFIFGPILFVLFLGLLPIGIFGFFLWVFVCTIFKQQNFSYLHFKPALNDNHENMRSKQEFTLASANIMLANEFFCRLNNNRNPLMRSKLIGKQLLNQSSNFLNNLTLSASPSKKQTIIEDLPDVDILCIQEVWERYWGASMIDLLRAKYSYFIHDVGDFRLRTNYCLFGSGLFVASKYPIEAAQFTPFQFRTYYAKIFSYGVLCMKVRLGEKRVAYIANFHGQAYQGKSQALYHQLSESLCAINAFRLKSHLPDEEVVFDSICGDFNFDNMSPGDAFTQKHPIFNQFVDVCSSKPGKDYPWAIGTELRQQRMHDPPVSTPKNFRNVLIDDLKRRYYLLDADVLEHTLALASIEPTPNNQGEIVAENWGGLRRIDRILIKRDSPVKVVGYAFSSALAGLTDHIPVVLSLRTNA